MIAPAGAGARSASSSAALSASAESFCRVFRMTLTSGEALIVGNPVGQAALGEPGGRPVRASLLPQLVDALHGLLRRHALGRRQERQRHRPQAKLEEAAPVRALEGVLALRAARGEQLELGPGEPP